MDNKERARRHLKPFRPTEIEISQLAAEFDAVANEAVEKAKHDAIEANLDAAYDKPTWKPGQMLVSRTSSAIFQVVKHEHGNFYTGKLWYREGWGPPAIQLCFDADYYESYPRVGDWVKPAMCDRAFQVSEVKGDRARTGLDWWNISDIEPASPPVEQEGQVSGAGCRVSGEKTTLEGPHWDEAFKEGEPIEHSYLLGLLCSCVSDLRDAVRELQSKK